MIGDNGNGQWVVSRNGEYFSAVLNGANSDGVLLYDLYRYQIRPGQDHTPQHEQEGDWVLAVSGVLATDDGYDLWTVPVPEPTVGPTEVTPTDDFARLSQIEEKFAEAFEARIGAIPSGWTEVDDEVRRFARVAWVVTHLDRARRVCGVLGRLTDKITISVNSDTGNVDSITALGDDLAALVKASGDPEEFAELLEVLRQQSGMSDHHLKRKLRKASTTVAKLPGAVEVLADPLGEEGATLHAELIFADQVLKSRTGDQAMIGLSMRCCAKCYLALKAVQEVDRIAFTIEGSHGNAYDKWRIPSFLLTSGPRMKAFLGDEAYGLYVQAPDVCQEVIRNFKLVHGGVENYYSSEEEPDEKKPAVVADEPAELTDDTEKGETGGSAGSGQKHLRDEDNQEGTGSNKRLKTGTPPGSPPTGTDTHVPPGSGAGTDPPQILDIQ
ncbi:hypothetical protein [Actinomadura craniellae]|nr:hypothetical protein [Actinomadura craniellae]